MDGTMIETRTLPCKTICENGGKPFNFTTCRCPGGLFGTNCESNLAVTMRMISKYYIAKSRIHGKQLYKT